jgi:hypothetical protein
MRRATLADTDAINSILNHPTVRPTIGGEGVLDSTTLLGDDRNRLYFDERGGAVFAWRGPGIYEGHSFFLVRGSEAMEAGRECLSLMADARMIWGNTPEDNRAARWFNRRLGFKSLGMIDTPDLGRCELFVLEN